MSKSKVKKYEPSRVLDLVQRLDENLALLELEGMRGCFVKLAEENIENHATPLEYLEALVEKQIVWKEDKRLQAWIMQARLGEDRKTLKQFDFSFQPTLDERLIRELASGRFIDEGKNIIFLGQAGTGKTHLAKALGEEVILRGYDLRFVEMKYFIPDFIEKKTDPVTQRNLLKSLTNPSLLILDDLREEKVPKEIKSFLYRLICSRYEYKKSIMFTSNQTFEDWAKLFGEYAGPVMDRIHHHAQIIIIEGDSHRLKDRLDNT